MDVWEALEAHRGKPVFKVDTYPDGHHRHFARFQGTDVTIIEIGVFGGGSLQLWRSYFGDRARVVGLDVDPACKAHEGEGIEVYIGDQADPAFLEEVADRVGRIDIVSDDGGHTAEQQITSFEVLFPRLSEHGVYACEDVSSSYLPEYGPSRAGRPHDGSFIEFAKSKIDEMHHWFSEGAEPTELSRTLRSIDFYPGLVVFEKGPVAAPRIAGSVGQGLAFAPMDALREPS